MLDGISQMGSASASDMTPAILLLLRPVIRPRRRAFACELLFAGKSSRPPAASLARHQRRDCHSPSPLLRTEINIVQPGRVAAGAELPADAQARHVGQH